MAVSLLSSNRLASDVFEDVSFEHTRAAEECILRIGHALTIDKPLLDKRDRADQVRHLKQFIVLRPDILGKLYATPDVVREHLVQKVCHRGLPAVVIDLYLVEIAQEVSLRRKEPLKLRLKSSYYSRWRVDVSLVHAEAMIVEIGATGEIKQELEYLCPPFATKRGKCLFLSDQGACMACEHIGVEPHTGGCRIQFRSKPKDVNRLVVEHKTYDVIARRRIGMPKSPRFVYEYT